MKRILFLIVFLVTYSNIFAFLTQRNWRWRNDDGTEVSATWKSNEMVPITMNSTSQTIRLRIEIYNNSGSSIGVLDTLEYATSPLGPLFPVQKHLQWPPEVASLCRTRQRPDN